MILGIGVDITDVGRIRRSFNRFGMRFAAKILSSNELLRLEKRNDKAAWLAKRFAAKEAVAKALGTGMRQGVHFGQIEIQRLRGGAPAINLSGDALEVANRLGVIRSHLSISDEADKAIAFAILEG